MTLSASPGQDDGRSPPLTRTVLGRRKPMQRIRPRLSARRRVRRDRAPRPRGRWDQRPHHCRRWRRLRWPRSRRPRSLRRSSAARRRSPIRSSPMATRSSLSSGGPIEQAVGQITSDALDSRALDAAVDRVLSSGAARRLVTIVINHPATDQLLVNTPRQPRRPTVRGSADGQPIPRRDRLPAARERGASPDRRPRQTSPEVRAALSQQTSGLAQDVTVGVRARTVIADDTVEQAARSLLRRPRRVQPE